MKTAGKIWILMLGIVSVGMALPHNRDPNDIEGRVGKEDIIRLLEKLRSHMHEPIPSLEIPQLEPLSLGDHPFDFNNSVAVVSGTVTGVQIKGLSGFVANDGDFPIIALTYKLNVSFPVVEITGDYQIRGVFADLLHVDGAGPFKVQILGANIYTDGKIKYENDAFCMEKMNLKLNISGINVNLEHLTDKETANEFANLFLTNAALPLFQLYRPMLESEAVKYVVPVFDEKMSGVTLRDLMEIFSGSKVIFP